MQTQTLTNLTLCSHINNIIFISLVLTLLWVISAELVLYTTTHFCLLQYSRNL